MTASMRCSVPSTTVQMLSAFRRPSVPSQCLCGKPVREGKWVRCAACQQALMLKAPLRQPQIPQFLREHTKECDCGRPRALEAPACPRCLWIDGIPEEEPIISSLRQYGALTLGEVVLSTRIKLKKAGPLMESLLRKNRVVMVLSRYELTLG